MLPRASTMVLSGAFLLVACNGRPFGEAGTKGDVGNDDGDPCEGAALQYADVCFFPHSVELTGYEHPLELDGEPGHELVGLEDGKVSVRKWNGNGFDLVGDAETPPKVSSPLRVVSGEFDDEPGLDLIVSEKGEWATLYHLDSAGRPMFVHTTSLSASKTTHAFESPVAVGPDAEGRWRIVAHFNDDEESSTSDHLALWEVQGTTLVDDRLDLPTDACEFSGCSAGDFNGDGRQDAVCTIMEYCTDPSPAEQIVHVVLLAQADGSVIANAYPTSVGPGSVMEGDLDGDAMADLVARVELVYRLADGGGGLEPAVVGELPPAPDIRWRAVSLGDVDGDTDAEFVLGEQNEMLVVQDYLGDATTHERRTVEGFEFGAVVGRPVDVNGDGVVDLPVLGDALLVSEIVP